jgi:hypothetical protein
VESESALEESWAATGDRGETSGENSEAGRRIGGVQNDFIQLAEHLRAATSDTAIQIPKGAMLVVRLITADGCKKAWRT